QSIPDDRTLQFRNRIPQQHHFRLTSVFKNDLTQSFVFSREGTVFRRSRRRKPPFVNASSFSAEHIIIIGMQLDSPSRNTKRPRHPCGSQSQNSFSLL